MHSVRSQARRHAYHTSSPLLKSTTRASEAGGLNEKQDAGRVGPGAASAARAGDGGGDDNNVDRGTGGGGGGTTNRDQGPRPEAANTNEKPDAPAQSTPPPAPPPDKSQAAGAGDPTLEAGGEAKEKKPIITRVRDGSKRFVGHFKDAVLSSWVNVLLVFVPVGIAVEAVGASPAIIFSMNAIAIVPLAGLLSHATESVATRLGDTLGALLNVSFGNAVELIIFIIALVKREIGIVQASLLGSILANLLLILGMAFLFGGLRYREQVYNSTITQMSACLLSLSVTSLLLPTAFHASFNTASADDADTQVLKVSRGTSVVLLLVYVLYLAFQLKSHAYLYESTPQAIIDEESHPGVLADIMNSSSSSDSDSSSSSDSDTSASITTAGKKIKRAFRRRRKSSGSASSVTNSATNSALSSPSATEHRNSYIGGENASHVGSRRQSALAPVASEADADADQEDNHGAGPRVRDFGKGKGSVSNSSESNKKLKKKFRKKKHRKHRKDAEKEETNGTDQAIIDDYLTAEPEAEPQVQFADEVQTAENTAANSNPSRSAFNMRLASSLHRPALPKMLSNNVFVTQPQTPQSHPRPLGPSRSASAAGRGLRRASSLPDRLNQQYSHGNTANGPVVIRRNALPPYARNSTGVSSNGLSNSATPDDDDDSAPPQMSRTAAVVLLLCSTALVAVCAEFMVDAIPHMITPGSAVSQTFIGLIILPIVGNAAEHVTAVTVAAKNKMDLAIGVAIGSSIQIALFITPFVVLLGWIMDRDMSLYFNLFETISLFVTAFVVNFLILDGRSNYLEGSLLIAAYVIIALGAFFYPQTDNQSAVGSVGTDGLGR